MAVRVGINGFGRIGRGMVRCAHERESDLEIVAVNDVTDATTLAALLARDSVYGRFPGEVQAAEGAIRIDDHEVRVLCQREPAALPWRELAARVLAPVRV
jgi:glyceraldehyde 3-phosphate dehydrogenase